MDAFAAYTVSTSGWLTLQALPQLFTPSVILQLLITDESKPDDLQIYLARSVALGQIALAAISILLSGLLPLTRDNTSVFATPTTFVTTAYHYMSAFQAYTSYASNNQTSYGLGVVGSGALAAMGTWAILFGGGSHISKRTGKDKRTSGFPFGDKEGRTAELKGN